MVAPALEKIEFGLKCAEKCVAIGEHWDDLGRRFTVSVTKE